MWKHAIEVKRVEKVEKQTVIGTNQTYDSVHMTTTKDTELSHCSICSYTYLEYKSQVLHVTGRVAGSAPTASAEQALPYYHPYWQCTGFKLYPIWTQITGWDSSFNTITGLNGSGKSNILAICFVLGITNMSQMHAHNQQDLIYKCMQAGVTEASVIIVFDNSEREKSPIGLENCNL